MNHEVDPEARQWRTVRAAILLIGDSGLRRDVAAKARRENLRPTSHTAGGASVWALTVVGKRRRQRTVPVSAVTISALRGASENGK